MRITALQNNFQTYKPAQRETQTEAGITADKISFAAKKPSSGKLITMITTLVACLSHGKVQAQDLTRLSDGTPVVCGKFNQLYTKDWKPTQIIRRICTEVNSSQQHLQSCVQEIREGRIIIHSCENEPLPPFPKPQLLCGDEEVLLDTNGTIIQNKRICWDSKRAEYVLYTCTPQNICEPNAYTRLTECEVVNVCSPKVLPAPKKNNTNKATSNSYGSTSNI